MSLLLPVNKIYETDLVIAFHHPRPSHSTHILIVPKRPIRSLMALTRTDMPVIQDVMITAQHMVKTFGLEESGFRLIVNGGAYQDIQQLHWHLVSEKA